MQKRSGASRLYGRPAFRCREGLTPIMELTRLDVPHYFAVLSWHSRTPLVSPYAYAKPAT